MAKNGKEIELGKGDRNHVQLLDNFRIEMPGWFSVEAATLPESVPALTDRMRIVNAFARKNFEAGTGGPFAAAVFETETGRLVSVGVNRVVEQVCTSAHA
jgi:hypothetical protein